MSKRRKRLSQLCVLSTTQRRAFLPASLAFFSSPLLRMWPAADVGGVAELPSDLAHLIVVVSGIHAQALFLTRSQMLQSLVFNALRHAGQRILHQLHVVTIGAFDLQPDRNPCRFSQQAALGAAFGAICRVGAAFFPRPAALWSSRHRVPANSSPSLQVRRSRIKPHAVNSRDFTLTCYPVRALVNIAFQILAYDEHRSLYTFSFAPSRCWRTYAWHIRVPSGPCRFSVESQ